MGESCTIELLFVPGCSSRDETVALIQRLAGHHPFQATITETFINTPEEAEERKILGSPSIRVNGIDIDPTAERRIDFGLGWRVYQDEAGRFLKKIPEKMLVSVLTNKFKRLRD